MNIGDRVRFLHSKEEGVIVKIRDNQTVEVEIEDGFQIPVLRSELAPISPEEAERFQVRRPASKDKKQANTPQKAFAEKGIYLAFYNVNDKRFAVYLINNTDYVLPFLQGTERNHEFSGENSGVLAPKTSTKIEENTLENFDKWGIFVFQFLFFRKEVYTMQEPWLRKLRIRPDFFVQEKQPIPLLNQKGYLFQLDQDSATAVATPPTPPSSRPQKFDLQTLKEKMFEPNEHETTTFVKENSPIPTKLRSKTIDLHIEELTKDWQTMNNTEILELQLQTFERTLESAILNGIDEIIFIHGVGKGILRTEIQKRLSQHSAIEFYADAQKEKFGYGATKVRLKG